MDMLIVFLLLVTMITARPMHAGINYHRYLQQKDQIATELDAWMQTFGTKAKENGWLPVTEARSADEVQEDRQQRFFMAKELVQTLEKKQTQANFTTNSPFTLMTVDEFAAFAQNQIIANQTYHRQRRVGEMLDYVDQGELPNGVDWSVDICMPPIRSQGPCGTCWAFATIAAVETSRCIAEGGGQLPYTFSEQSVASCNQNGVNCQGGYERVALDYVMTNGVCAAADDPYTVNYGNGYNYLNGCNQGCSRKETGLKGYGSIYGQDGLINALNRHPVIVTVASSPAEFKQYQQGVLSASTCEGWPNDHAVVAVGYDRESFKIRNSWDVSWGEQGYFRLAREESSDGTCGLYRSMTELQF